jgi:DNA gyrase subunit B
LDSSTNSLHNKVITINKESGEAPIDVAMRYNDGYSENILSFVNNINTIEGGTHMSGFRSALTRGLNSYGNKNNLIKGVKGEKITLSGEDFREGLTAVVSIKVAGATV